MDELDGLRARRPLELAADDLKGPVRQLRALVAEAEGVAALRARRAGHDRLRGVEGLVQQFVFWLKNRTFR